MKTSLFLWIFFLASWKAVGQMPIHDPAVVAQRERMVFKDWDEDKFYPRPNRILGIPANPIWYMTWALHPDYPKLDRRPLSPSGEQTQRLGLATAMNITSDYYKKEADSVRVLATKEMARISGAVASADPLYQLYYKKELRPLENFGAWIFTDVPIDVQTYLQETGSLAWFLEIMGGLAERYQLAKTLDMERGQRILMYHRILQEMRDAMEKWKRKVYLSQQVLEFKVFNNPVQSGNGQNTPWKEAHPLKVMNEIIRNRNVLK